MLNRLKIGHKIFSGSLISIILTVFVGFIGKTMLEKVLDTELLHAKFDRLEILVLEMRRAEKDLLLNDSKDPQFMITGASRNLDQLHKSSLKFDQITVELQKNQLVDQLSLRDDLTKLIELEKSYLQTVNTLQQNIRRLGYRGHGEVGKLWAISSKIRSGTPPAQQVSFLDVVQSHQDFFLTNDPQAADKGMEHLEVFMNRIDQTELAAFNKGRLVGLGRDYQAQFRSILVLMEKIGLNSQKGIKGQAASLANDLIQRIKKAEKFTEEEALNTRDLAVSWIGTLVIAAVIIALIGAAWFSKWISSSVLALKDTAQQIAEGNLDVQVESNGNDEIAELAQSLTWMVNNLKTRTDEMEIQDWIKTSLGEVIQNLQGIRNLRALGDQLLSTLIPLLDAKMGAFYVMEECDDRPQLKRISTFAFDQRKGDRSSLEMGQGLVGQSALEQKPFSITNLPEDYMPISSALGEKTPSFVLVFPVIFEKQTLAVLELASFDTMNPMQRTLVEQVISHLSNVIANVQSQMATDTLLRETQAQNEEIQSQAEELEEANSQLEEYTNELRKSQEEAELRNAELEKAEYELRKRAEALSTSSKYKSEFLANMSHELRTPLNSILILSKLLSKDQSGSLTEQQIKHADTIHSAGSDLLQLINEVLDLSKIEAGHMTIKSRKFAVQDIEDYTRSLFEQSAKDKGIELKIIMSDKLPDFLFNDLDRIQQVTKNFMSNAFKYTEQGSVSLEVAPSSGANTIKMSVTDSGIGIPKDKHHTIFEAFQQIDGTTTRKYSGTGLGLAICNKIADLMGGKITLESEEGQGSCFMFEFPANLEESSETATKKSSPELGRLPLPRESYSSQKPSDDTSNIAADDKILLIVEDDPMFAETLMEVGRKWQYKVILADTGTAAIRLAEKYIPAAIILDIKLPVMDGWVVLQSLKRNQETRHIPVHIISGIEDEGFGLKLGAFNYSTKPISAEGLDQAFQELEHFSGKVTKEVLIIEDDERERNAIIELVGSDDINITAVGSGNEALQRITSQEFDCIIVDLRLPDFSGTILLDQINEIQDRSRRTPVIVYTGKDLSDKEEQKLGSLSDSIIIKSVNSPARLLEETTIFLHRVKERLGNEKLKLLEELSSPERIFQDKTVLVVDDDIRNVYAVASALESKGLKVLTAGNGKDALELLGKDQDAVSIILLDMMMPIMDGYETARRIREMNHYRSIPIIALTAKAMKGDRAQCIEAGASDYLSKPIDLQQLTSLLRVWLSVKPEKTTDIAS